MNLTATLNYKPLLAVAGVIAVTAVLIAGIFAATVSAASQHIGVSSNVTDVPGGANLTMTIKHADSAVHRLEVDHSLQGTLPEFHLHANEADPYGGDQADFAAVGMTVTYSAAAKEWVLNFGPTVTSVIRDTPAGIAFYFALKDVNGTYLWGDMYNVTDEMTFNFDLVAGTGDSVVLTPAEPEAVIPGVPNTGTVN